MTSTSSRVQLQRLLKNEAQVPPRAIRCDSIYNLKDFLPNTSAMCIETGQKGKSMINGQSTSQLNMNSHHSAANIMDEKLIQKKMNKLKHQNIQLLKELQEQKLINCRQNQQIAYLKKLNETLKQKQQNKIDKLSIWSYKYHIEYTPKQKQKYSLAIQTEDKFKPKNQPSGLLRAKDFQDIYRKLNSNSLTVQMATKKTNKQSISQKSTMNFTLNNNHTASQFKIQKGINQNKSIFKIGKKFIQKQNIMFNSNLNLDKNPMDINLAKLQMEQKLIQQQSLEIYPIEEQYLDSIVGQLLCDDQ